MTSAKAPDDFDLRAKVCKVDADLGLVMGFAIICTKNGEPYFDVQEDHVPDDSMLKASLDFMQNSRIAKEMHTSEEAGTVVFAWPMTAEIAKAFEITIDRTGLMIAMRPDAEMLKRFQLGELTGFSIGGKYVTNEEAPDAA